MIRKTLMVIKLTNKNNKIDYFWKKIKINTFYLLIFLWLWYNKYKKIDKKITKIFGKTYNIKMINLNII